MLSVQCSNTIINTKNLYKVQNISKYGFNDALFVLSKVLWLIVFQLSIRLCLFSSVDWNTMLLKLMPWFGSL